LCSLLRNEIIEQLELKTKYGLELIPRDPSSFTPMLDGKYLMLGYDHEFNKKEIAKFSERDSENYGKYEKYLSKIVKAIDPILDISPLETKQSLMSQSDTLKVLFQSAYQQLGLKNVPELIEILTSPATKILGRWFESEPLLSTLGTDAIIGAMISPSETGSSYVLLHHVMGDAGPGGIWCYVKGGMGAISDSIAQCAKDRGVEIQCNQSVKSIIVEDKKAKGVLLSDGTKIYSDKVISNCNAYTTYLEFMDKNVLPKEFVKDIEAIDFTSATFKINLAVDSLPNFKCIPTVNNEPGPQHRGTIHFIENMEQIEQGYRDAVQKKPSKYPIIEMTIPSALDKTIAPEGKHVVQLFTQYAPYELEEGKSWDDPGRKEEYANSCYDVIEQYCPGFKKSIIGEDLLSPLDLERIFSLKGGNIFHGSMRLDQLFWYRPAPGYSRYSSPIEGLFICGSGSHPGGGVMGAPGRNCARVILKNKK
jgi:phytoene dehydrogenase-like protein